MTPETDLRTAMAYLTDLDGELEERRALPVARMRSVACDDMLYQLEHARQLVASLEQQAANASCMSCDKGCEVLLDVPKLRAWCRSIEAQIASIRCDEISAAAA